MGVKFAVLGKMGLEEERLEKPTGVGEMPFRRTYVGH
jgi:hypothetical protein